MNLGNSCPDCGTALGKSAYKCRCGWRMDKPQAKSVDCFYAPRCTRPAILREVEDGVAKNLCYECSLNQQTKRAEDFCNENGFITRVQKMNRCRELAGMAGLPFVERVPGEDDEPRRFMPGVRAKEVAGA